MKESDQKVLGEFAGRVRQIFPHARIWAFGSRARGDAHPESDFDICVVAPGLSSNKEPLIQDIAWEVAFANGMVIMALCYSEEDFTRGPRSVSPIVRNILKEGIAA